MFLFKQEKIEFIFKNFELYEEDLVQFMKIVPFSEESKNTWSPRLVNLFLDICSFFDSLCRFIVSKGVKDVNTKISIKDKSGKIIAKKIKDLDIEDFENNLLKNIDVFNSNVAFYTYPLEIIKPFESYRNRENNGWWNVYNDLKHNRLINYQKATLKNTIKALSSLFLLLVRYKEDEIFSNLILIHKWSYSRIVPEYFHRERIDNGFRIWYDSPFLFGAPDLPNNLPDNIEEIKKRGGLSIGASTKFIYFLGRHNWDIK